MRNFGIGRLNLSKRNSAVFFLMIVFFFGFSLSTALAASGAKGWISTDWFRVMNFAVLVIVLVFLLRKPLSQALGARITGIKDQLEDLEARKAEAENQLAEYNEKLSRLEKESEKIVEDYIKQGNEAKARILKEAESAAEKLQIQARRNIEHEFKQAKLKLQEEIFESSLAKAEEIITGKISGEDQDRLVDEYLRKVEAG
ncbi:MAG: ATP synthase F0 subunit B [Desulfobacterales bacterium]|jgi:F-type H+-transporting ATPase subunit b